jgi:hypothetical protein
MRFSLIVLLLNETALMEDQLIHLTRQCPTTQVKC